MKILERKNIEFIKGLLMTILIIAVCFALFDLYAPLKLMVLGEHLNFSEIIEYIKIKEQLPIIIGAAVALEYTRYGKNNKVANKND